MTESNENKDSNWMDDFMAKPQRGKLILPNNNPDKMLEDAELYGNAYNFCNVGDMDGNVLLSLIGKAKKEATISSHKNKSSQGGKATAKAKQEELIERNSRIVSQAKTLLDNGRERKDLSGILSKQFDLTPRQINNILKEAKT